MSDATIQRIGFLVQDFGSGGVERCFHNLARGFATRGVDAHLYCATLQADAPSLDPSDESVQLLDANSQQEFTHRLAERLDGTQSAVLLAAKEQDCRLALDVKARMPERLRTVFVASLNYSGQLAGRGAGPWQRWRRRRELNSLFQKADGVFCVSQGVARDMATILRRDESSFSVLPNPVITPDFTAMSELPLAHPWFVPGQPPVVIGVGRLSRIKNFPLLVKAFARVRQHMELRLVIVGEGKHRPQLERLAARLGVAEDFLLTGYLENPYPYVRGASLFVLSSLWEGFGNVVVEALACGTPVVATDCPSGPAEILQHGRYGTLVPVDDEIALSEAMLDALRNPVPAHQLAEAVRPYTLQQSTDAYLRALAAGGFSVS